MPSTEISPRPDAAKIKRLLERRVLMLDGAMGTMIQSYNLDEAGYRGERFQDFEADLKGNNDILSLTQPGIIEEIHESFLRAGADIIETNTFNGTSISQADYSTEEVVYEINRVSAEIAKGCQSGRSRHAGQAALCRRRPRADEQNRLDFAGCKQSRLPQCDV